MIDKMKMIVPALPEDAPKLLENIESYFSCLPVKEICLIGPSSLKPLLPSNDSIVFMNENELAPFEETRNLIVERTKNEKDGKRAGWYVQQFVKMAYARICSDDYYLLWDSDTVPLRTVEMFSEDKPVFHLKTEFHPPYFRTMENLLPSLRKSIDGSFISEHMIIRTSLMREMLSEIESNSGIEGKNFREKIINAVPAESLPLSGFSEFETFGTYVMAKHPDDYGMKEWASMRHGGFFYEGGKSLSYDDVSWLSRCYDAVSFEKGDYLSPLSRVATSTLYKRMFASKTLAFWAFLIKAWRKTRGKR